MYINDIYDVSKLLKIVLFADNTNLYCSFLKQLLNVMEGELKKLKKKWFVINKLSPNLSKTKFSIFGNWNVNNSIRILINNVETERVYEKIWT